jgi:DNA ligase-1
MSYDSVGDLSETVALMWPSRAASPRETPSLSEVVATRELGKLDLPAQLRWLDALDETGRCVVGGAP